MYVHVHVCFCLCSVYMYTCTFMYTTCTCTLHVCNIFIIYQHVFISGFMDYYQKLKL